MLISICQFCGAKENVQKLMFCENVSYFFKRTERIFEGPICSSCMKIIFSTYTKTTLAATWFGVIGMLIGPIYIFSNIYYLIKGLLKFWFETSNCRGK
jgi:hypothetical protein